MNLPRIDVLLPVIACVISEKYVMWILVFSNGLQGLLMIHCKFGVPV